MIKYRDVKLGSPLMKLNAHAGIVDLFFSIEGWYTDSGAAEAKFDDGVPHLEAKGICDGGCKANDGNPGALLFVLDVGRGRKVEGNIALAGRHGSLCRLYPQRG